MRKALIGILAAMMLFAFTACEPQQIDLPYTGSDAKEVTKVLLSDSSSVKFYAGQGAAVNTYNTYIDIYRLDDTVTEDVVAEVSIADAKPGENLATVKWGKDNTGSIIVNAMPITKLEAVIEVAEDGAVVGTDGSITSGVTVKSITGYYEDGKTQSFSASLTGTVKTAVVDGVFTATLPATTDYTDTDVVYTQNIAVKPDEADKATQWIVYTGDDEIKVGDTIKNFESYSVAPIAVDFGDSVSSVESKIQVLAVTDEGKVVSFVTTGYKIYGLPSGTFSEVDDSSKEPETTDLYTVAMTSYDPEITFSKNTGTITIADPLNLSTLKVEWNGESKFVPSTTDPTPDASDFKVTASKKSGADISAEVSVEVLFPTAVYEGQTGYVNYIVGFTYNQAAVVDADGERVTKSLQSKYTIGTELED